jgi:hypothetical protein
MKDKQINRAAQVNPGYALFQIARALTTSEEHDDLATRERAKEKILKWHTVLTGILSGKIGVGSRTPLEGVPAWATLEVITGGFATGELLAGGPLLEHEQALLKDLSPSSDSDGRRILNGYYLTEEGLAQLWEWLRTGCYEIGVPEEGALMVVAWLVENGHAGEVRTLLEEIAAYFPRLRFYPIPVERPRLFGSRVFLQDVGSTIGDLRKIKPNQHILAQKEAIEIWAPLYDRIVELFLETLEGGHPTLRDNNSVEGGWPCKNYPEGWRERAQSAIDDYSRLRSEHKLCGKPDRPKENFTQLRDYMSRCIKAPEFLSGRDVSRVRLILARYLAKRGAPNSSYCRSIREKQAGQVSGPTFQDISKILISRLEIYPKNGGVDDLLAITEPITTEEEKLWKIQAGRSVPPSLQRKAQRSLSETVGVLVERKVITSGETLARVLPQISSQVRAAGITDPALSQLYGAIYRAFRRRRSLLLLNLESQIKIEELPWVGAIDRFRNDNLSIRELSKQTLEEVTSLAITSFPQAILPNKLLQELRALAKGADLNLPIVDEVAADIFMGQFSETFLRAARRAADLLEGTLYERYYGVDYNHVRQIPETKHEKSWWPGRSTQDPFVELCSTMAGVIYGGWDPAINGMIIEQQQIITTQNLAVLFEGLNLRDVLRGSLYDLAQQCFVWICRRQQVKSNDYHASLIMLKNTAYAWRQMVFFLALLPSASVQTFLTWADGHLKKQEEGFQSRFRPALQGLVLVAEGCSLDDSSTIKQGANRFLGWSKKRHWLLG